MAEAVDEKIASDDEISEKLSEAESMLSSILEEAKVCVSHGIKHAVRVMTHVKRALARDKIIPPNERLAILLAALLHDADDRKFFPKNVNYENARKILRLLFPMIEERVVNLISYVSASKNGNSIPEEAKSYPWVLWPRYADRLEGTGWVGVVRCWEYTLSSGTRLFTEATLRARTESEVNATATKERFLAYKGASASMIDHYYDKLLHICPFESENPYLDHQSRVRRKALVSVCIVFGMLGSLPEAVLKTARLSVDEEFEENT
jgi:uncharacterized protein